MQHHAAITMRFASTRKLAPIYAQNNTRTPNDNSHAAIPMRSASTDSKTPYNYTHTSTPKAASSHRYTAAKKKRQTDRSRTRRTHEVPFIVACSHFTRKNTRFRAPASSPNHSPCNIHAAMTNNAICHSITICNQRFKNRIGLRTSGTTTRCKTQSRFFTHVLSCSVKSHTTLHQSQFFTHVLFM